MANEIGPFDAAYELVFLQPDDPTKARKVTGTGSGNYVSLTPLPTFSEYKVTAAQLGSTPFYYASFPAGLSAASVHPIRVYEAGATAFTDDFTDTIYEPSWTETIPAIVWDRLTSALTTTGSIGKWLLDNVLGALGGVIAPVLAVVRELSLASSTGGIDRALKLFENSRSTVSWTVVNGAGDRYDLTGHAFAFVAHGQTGTTQFGINSTNEAAQFVLSSSESDSTLDVISVTLTPTELVAANVGTWSYKMWDTTIDAVLGSGQLSIPHAPQA